MAITFVTAPLSLGEMIHLARVQRAIKNGLIDMDSVFELMKLRAAPGTPEKEILDLRGQAFQDAVNALAKSLNDAASVENMLRSLSQP